MTVTYSLEVAQARLCGLTKLLLRWRGSIYKLIWREMLIYIGVYYILNLIYRFCLSPAQKVVFEALCKYCLLFNDLIPLSFVLGFYVSLVVGRWWNQYDAIPWPDRTCLLINSMVHGVDERSRMIRRNMGRYLLLMQVLTFQAVSTQIKKRFPTTEHLLAAGLFTEEEYKLYENTMLQVPIWWLPAQWFTALTMRARKEGRIKDSIQMSLLLQELLNFRSMCGNMFSYDWISVPLVYTQVVTLATYAYFMFQVMAQQILDPSKDTKRDIDVYFPFFVFLQFLFYVGWLKVAEQIMNPYGEDDDDFELNWCLDRNLQVVYLLVDKVHYKHPKLKRDIFWDDPEPKLPHTILSAQGYDNPQVGSAANMEINWEDGQFVPLHEEEGDLSPHLDTTHRPSFLRNVLGASFRKPRTASVRNNSISRSSSRRRSSVRNGQSGAPERKLSTQSNLSTGNHRYSFSKQGMATTKRQSIFDTKSSSPKLTHFTNSDFIPDNPIDIPTIFVPEQMQEHSQGSSLAIPTIPSIPEEPDKMPKPKDEEPKPKFHAGGYESCCSLDSESSFQLAEDPRTNTEEDIPDLQNMDP